MRKEDTKQQITIHNLKKQINDQEKMLQEQQCFIKDTLSQIFTAAERHEDEIKEQVAIHGSRWFSVDKDPFRLYQSYLELVKPIDYQNEVDDKNDMIEELQKMLAEAN